MTERPALQCLAVDDEPHALQILGLYIEKTPFLDLAHSTTSPWEAMEYLKSKSVDLLFLDIQMEGLNGLQLLDIAGPACPVILTTAYTEYAISGYEYQVSDYLLKPYSFDRFLKAVSQVYHQQEEASDKPANTSLPTPEKAYLFVKGDAKNKFHKLHFKDICYVEGLRNYVQFVCKDKKVISLQNLKDVESQLSSQGFIRVHKSYIVSLDHIEDIEGNSLRISNQQIPIGSNYRTAFFDLIDEHRMG